MVITRSNYPYIATNDKPDLAKFISSQDYIWDRSTTLQTDCIANQIAMSDMNFYDTRLLRSLKDGTATYKFFKDTTITRFVDKYYRLFENKEWNAKAQSLEGHALSGAMLDLYDFYKEHNTDEDTTIDNLGQVMFPKFTNDSDIHRWAALKYNSRISMLRTLSESIINYRDVYGIPYQHALSIKQDIKNDRFTELRRLFTKIAPSLYSNKLSYWNGLRVGLGCVLFSLSVKNDSSRTRNLRGWRDGLLDFSFNDSMFTYITKYDFTVISHGDDLMYIKNDYHIQPVKLYTDLKTYHSVSELILAIEKMSWVKRINILACNPNELRVYPELYKDKTHLINIHQGNVFIG